MMVRSEVARVDPSASRAVLFQRRRGSSVKIRRRELRKVDLEGLWPNDQPLAEVGGISLLWWIGIHDVETGATACLCSFREFHRSPIMMCAPYRRIEYEITEWMTVWLARRLCLRHVWM